VGGRTVERFEVYGGEFAAEPAGGMRDYLRSYGELAHAVAFAEGYMTGSRAGGWTRIYDSGTGQEVWTDAQGTY
jgi:hypothetical protein